MTVAAHAELTIDDRLHALALELRQLVVNMRRPSRDEQSWNSWSLRIREGCQELSDRLGAFRDKLVAHREALRHSLGELGTTLQRAANDLSERCTMPRLRELRRDLATAYEDFVAQMRAAQVRIPRQSALGAIRLPKLARSVFHAAIGLVGVLLYELVLTRPQVLTILVSCLSVFTTLEITRRFSARWNDFLVDRVFGAISRPRERYRVNSATYYLLALTAIAIFAPKGAVCAAVLVLGFGDPVASAVGSRWGRIRLSNDKSLVGSAAFFLMAGLAMTIYLAAAFSTLPLSQRFGITLTVAATGTLVELLSSRVDDNFTIPVACALVGLLFF